MSSWIDFTPLWEIVVVGLLAGAGLPAVFALGLRALGVPARGRTGSRGRADSAALAGGNPAGIAVAALCFAVVLAAIGFGIYLIVAGGHKLGEAAHAHAVLPDGHHRLASGGLSRRRA